MKSNKSRVVVLLATYNGEKHIYDQIQSIRNQQKTNVKLMVSDDCSTDNTLSILKKLCDDQPPIELLPPKKNSGACGNFFRLIMESHFKDVDYIALSDQDDIWSSNKLICAIDSIEKYKADAYSGNVTAYWPDGKKKLIDKAQLQRRFDYMFESAGPGCTFVFTKELAMDLKRFLIRHKQLMNDIALHDWFIYAFARSRGYKWYIDPVPHMMYRQHENNVVGANFGVNAILSRWAKLQEGWLVSQAIFIASILGYSDAWPIKRLQRFGFFDRCYLVLNIGKFRRRFRDRVAFAMSLFFTKK